MSAFEPRNVFKGPNGRWYHDGVDVTDWPVWWTCKAGHDWQASLALRLAPDDVGCPQCAVATAFSRDVLTL